MTDINALTARWRTTVDTAAAELTALSDARARARPAPDKWSVKEIIGHLVDSAANNHRRFVIAQLRDGLTFDGYEQDGWVASQHYRDAAWPELVTLWQVYNHHLIHVASRVPVALLEKPETDHNFYDIASRSVPKGTPTTLGFFIDDYVFHLDHHLAQVRALLR